MAHYSGREISQASYDVWESLVDQYLALYKSQTTCPRTLSWDFHELSQTRQQFCFPKIAATTWESWEAIY